MSNEWKKVLATHEEPQELSSGPWLGDHYPGVALPSTKILGKWIELRYKDKAAPACAMDVGPWCEDDHFYCFTNARPRAEEYKGQPAWKCPRVEGTELVATVDGKEPDICNGAGIDLFPGTANALGIPIGENVEVEWRLWEL